MPVGDAIRYNSKNAARKLYYRLFGVLDLHSHIRWQAIKPYVDKFLNKNAEIGGGWGVMSFEFVKTTGKSIDCIEVDSKVLQLGRELANKAGIKGVRFVEDSLPRLSKLERNYYDQVLLIDVLEHVKEDLESLITINSILKRGGYLIISVPTTYYPRYFSYNFADKIGHVREGYSIETLQKLLNYSGFKIIRWSYHTNFLSPYLCKLGYNLPRKLRIILFPLLKVLGCLDFVGKGINSCGIALKAKKERHI
jgi:ubiquinone/menaquinone biosynthesis C-methylase UbiE